MFLISYNCKLVRAQTRTAGKFLKKIEENI